MKKFSVICFLFVLVAFAETSYSQRFQGAFSAGMNLTQVDGDEIYGFYHVGLNAGPSVLMPFTKNKKWTVTLEMDYSQVGSYQKYGPTDTSGQPNPYRKFDFDYVVVPVLVHFTDKRVVAAGVGFSYAALISSKRTVGGYSDTAGTVNNSDLSVIADLRLRLWQRLWFNFRYSYSMIKIGTHPWKNELNQQWERDMYNNVLTFRLTYIFNEEIEKKKKK
jgi:hypothetical protein